MSEQHIHIGVEEAERGFERFMEAWHSKIEEAEVHLNIEDFAKLVSL